MEATKNPAPSLERSYSEERPIESKGGESVTMFKKGL